MGTFGNTFGNTLGTSLGRGDKSVSPFLQVQNALIANALWDKVAVMYVFNEFAKELTYINIKGNYATITEEGTVAYDIEKGISSDGSAGYLNTNYNLSTSSVVTKDDCCISIYINGSMVNKSQGWIDATVGNQRTGLFSDGSKFYSQIASDEVTGNWTDMGVKPYPGMIFMDTNNDADFANTTIKLLKNGTAFSDGGSSMAYFAVTKNLTAGEKTILTSIIEEYLYGSQYYSFYVNNPATVNQVTLRVSSEEDVDLKVRFNDGAAIAAWDTLGFVEDKISAYTNINCYNKVIIYGDINKIWYFKTENLAYVVKLNLQTLATKLTNIRVLDLKTPNATTFESSTSVFSARLRELAISCEPAQNIGLNVSNLPALMYSLSLSKCTGVSGTLSHFTQIRFLDLLSVSTITPWNVTGWGQYLYWFRGQSGNLITGNFETMVKSSYYDKDVLPEYLRDNDLGWVYINANMFYFPFVANSFTGSFTEALKWSTAHNVYSPSVLPIALGASSALTANIEDIMNYAASIYIIGNSPGIIYGGGNVNANAKVAGTIQTGLTTANIDALIINLAANITTTTAETLDLRGINQARSSASDAAIATLLAKNKIILTN